MRPNAAEGRGLVQFQFTSPIGHHFGASTTHALFVYKIWDVVRKTDIHRMNIATHIKFCVFVLHMVMMRVRT